MDVFIDINTNIKEQFARYFKLIPTEEGYRIHPDIGTKNAVVKYVEFPGQLEFYHFGLTEFKVPIDMKSVNPADTDWFVVHINLSHVKQIKEVNGDKIAFQKHLPIGTLLYGPGLEISTHFPTNTPSEVCTLRFSRSLLKDYFGAAEQVMDMNKNIVYEELDARLESILLSALNSMLDKIRCHALILDFLKRYFDKLKQHEEVKEAEKLHPEDIKSLFGVMAVLRDPLAREVPSLKVLARQANMGTTKFKTSFRQLFGMPPFEYRNKIRMEFARQELSTQGKSPTELSYALGYAHPSNFTAAYKKYFGELPSGL
ncbi:helix-turn-helix transcriptional regulator [Catalinimonas sp. 4WD22]|uniref:helix-turn-helix transcriptional regulator n=1 Tax=Catalinimonas locisalis TaxID=3133978 RepID=UPI0031018EC5